mgnify:CR=1 FL=1
MPIQEKMSISGSFEKIKQYFSSLKVVSDVKNFHTYRVQRKDNILMRYLVKELFVYFFIAFLFFFLVFFVNQILLVMQDILSKRVPFGKVMLLMTYSLPFIIAQSAPFGTLVGFLMCIGRLMTDNEILILRATGTSFFKLSLPVIVLGLLISILSFFVNDYLLPVGTLKYNELTRQIVFSNPAVEIESNSIKRMKDSIFVVGEVKDREVSDIIVFDTDPDNNMRIIVSGKTELLKPEDKSVMMQLKMHSPTVVQFSKEKKEDYDYMQADYLTLNMFESSVRDVSSSGTNPREMTSFDLHRYIKNMKSSGNVSKYHLNTYKVELNKKFAMPFGSIFFAMLAFPLAIIFGKHNGQTIGLIIGILISVVYWVLLTLGQVFGLRNGWNGFLCMWIPNVIVGTFGIIFFIFLVKK